MDAAGTTQYTGMQQPAVSEPQHLDTHLNTPLSQTDPQYQHAVNPPQQAAQPLVSDFPAAPIVSAGIFGLIVAGTGAMGSNLHRVENGEIGMGEAISDSLVRGAAGGAAAAGATAAATTLTSGGILGLAVTLATATGISYILSK
ncbi:MAG: hypothetical protein CSA20_02135 [Deltaproteobacteria bacterium]|nr:MAG: hypothetical protein CSA20_02135 [Deltaproteobacteria bacterium]